MNNAKIGTALLGGYLLGRSKKAKLALGLGALLAGSRMNPGQVGKALHESPFVHTLTDQVRSELTGAGKAAATNLLSAKAGNLADVIHERTSGLQGRAEAQDEEQEEEEEQDEEQDEENGEEPRGSPRASPGSPGRKPGRRPPGTRGAASPGSRARNSPASGRPPPHRAARAAAAAAARGRGGGTMAEDEATGRGSRGTGTKSKADEQVSGTQRLKEELEHYVEARLQVLLEGVGDRLGAGARRLGEAHVSPRGLTHAVARGGKKLGAHLPSGVGALTSTASHAKETASHAKDTVVGKAKQATGQGSGQSDDTDTGPGDDADTDSGDDADADTDTDSGDDKGKRSDPQSMGKGITVIEDIDVGVPVREAYGQWTQFQEFDRFAKGVVSVEQEDDTTTKWHLKVGKSKRQLRGMITEQVPDERIAWTSSGNAAPHRASSPSTRSRRTSPKCCSSCGTSPRGRWRRSGAGCGPRAAAPASI